MNPLWSSVATARTLKAFTRDRYSQWVSTTGKYVAAQMRHDGFVPATVQGRGVGGKTEQLIIMTPYVEVEKELGRRGLSLESTLYKLEHEDGSTELVLPRGVKIGNVTRQIASLNFARYDPEVGSEVLMPIDFTDEEICPGIKRGGFLNEVTRSLRMKISGEEIPHALEASLRNLDVGQRLWYKDLEVPNCVQLAQKIPRNQQDIMICNIIGKRSLMRAVAQEQKAKKK
mmetsp:Transcript_9906/g.19446  ORF Transcript_9906/g.19446 Transcript_9906/m.19446 type:complete len:229 (-) Transcript_9906:2105-2791(-)|eukprot:CAMPEP_0171491464 /NCGR_PEP_ID=MMETSP0958-20121227/3874_1 /TAXON_ID=87120 /ORGANISM="Aurantiochytrium limacinum, Strain ATCCMYA-1381" /LENGTH=228 /DNA_ID=CAMNT_0012024885 /DNA_START=120 /DNA_END=806 /DNA_ORIENTATION=+